MRMTCDLASIDGIRHEFTLLVRNGKKKNVEPIFVCFIDAYEITYNLCEWKRDFPLCWRIKKLLFSTFPWMRKKKSAENWLIAFRVNECFLVHCLDKDDFERWTVAAKWGHLLLSRSARTTQRRAQFTYISMFFSQNNKSAAKLESDRFDGWWPARLLC